MLICYGWVFYLWENNNLYLFIIIEREISIGFMKFMIRIRFCFILLFFFYFLFFNIKNVLYYIKYILREINYLNIEYFSI